MLFFFFKKKKNSCKYTITTWNFQDLASDWIKNSDFALSSCELFMLTNCYCPLFFVPILIAVLSLSPAIITNS